MAKIHIPERLEALVRGSSLEGPIKSLANSVGTVLYENQMPFFPAYTDHGVDHINKVLEWEVRLVPTKLWGSPSERPILTTADAVILIGGTLLHDLAMYLQPGGLLELIAQETRFRPLPWFRDHQDGHAADRPWRLLWEDYDREAKRLDDSKLEDIVGPKAIAAGWRYEGLPENPAEWNEYCRLVVGEFLRRHHARLAHEIAIYGFPGLRAGTDRDEFPAIGEKNHDLKDYADLIGLTARSHGISLRVCQEYLKKGSVFGNALKPKNSAILFPMALLRVADYFQIDADRAPPVLLQLKDPQSRISVDEWRKHKTIIDIGDADADPRGKMLTVDSDVPLHIYLQLRELIAGLQAEIDHSSAVLDEAYGLREELKDIGLSIRRVHSNLTTKAFREGLPFVPERTGFSADPQILNLLIEPLYGKAPYVGARELVQNAVDAVRELTAWCGRHGKEIQKLDLPRQEPDVLVEYSFLAENPIVRVRDKGIGMTAQTVQSYFLRAGVSFRGSPEWTKDFLDDQGKPAVLRAGRFGIGAFAMFLLGNRFRLYTRHVTSAGSRGLKVEAAVGRPAVEIRYEEGLPVGTTLEVELSQETLALLKPLTGAEFVKNLDWYVGDWPTVAHWVIDEQGRRLISGSADAGSTAKKTDLPWFTISQPPYVARWTFGDAPPLAVNGFRIDEPPFSRMLRYSWPGGLDLAAPCLDIEDEWARLELTVHRYRLADPNLPFLDDLIRDVLLSCVAYTLVCGPSSFEEAMAAGPRHPLGRPVAVLKDHHVSESRFDHPGEFRRAVQRNRRLIRWCATESGMVPFDRWMISLLGRDSLFVTGHSRLVWKDYESLHAKYVVAAEAGEKSGCSVCVCYAGRANLANLIESATGGKRDPFDVGTIVQLAVAVGSTIPRELRQRLGLQRYQWQELESLPGASNGIKFFEVDRKERAEGKNADLCQNLAAIAAPMGPLDIAFAAEVRVDRDPSPVSRLARIWDECLGAHFIPFDSTSRRELIEKGRQHPDLSRHIDSWEKLKSQGSKWVEFGKAQ